MEYRLKIGEKTIPVEASPGKEQNLELSLGRDTIEIDYAVISRNEIHLDINGIAAVAYVADTSDGKTVMINGVTYLVQDADTVEHTSRKKGSNEIPEEVTPPMPSVIVRFMVNVGDMVEKGKCLLVVSAMKMETPINAPYSGEVTGINAAVGEKVMPGQILVNIKKQ